MAYTLANLRTDIRGYTEVSDTVLTDAVLATQIKNAENAILIWVAKTASPIKIAFSAFLIGDAVLATQIKIAFSGPYLQIKMLIMQHLL